ncbi:MAG TPA: NADH-quinone oxidoreductase subunit M [Bryobacteraceae bacterium]
MILFWLIIVLLVGGLISFIAARWSSAVARWIAFAATVIDFTITLYLWVHHAGQIAFLSSGTPGAWLENLDWVWISYFGIHFHLALDGLSLLLLAITFFVGALSILTSWKEITDHIGLFYLNALWTLAGIAGVFLAADLFLFYFAWELMLVPMYFLIALWGHARRTNAAIKFFLFTQAGGLLMLVAILALYFLHYQATGVFTFEYNDLLNTPLSPTAALWIMLGFFAAFATKLPLFPFHTWLPDACSETSTSGAVILASLLAKTSAYALIRFLIPLFPHASREFSQVAMGLAVASILYGAILAFGQTDLKRLIAYTSISHLGFVVLAVFTWNTLALQGAVMTMICHALSTGALFVLIGSVEERTRTRSMEEMGGLWSTTPRLGGATLFFALASMGLPGLGDFIGEFLILLGVFRSHPAFAVIGAVGVLASTFYALLLIQRAFQGPNVRGWSIPDMVRREAVIVTLMGATLLWLGLNPQPVLNTFKPALQALEAVIQVHR